MCKVIFSLLLLSLVTFIISIHIFYPVVLRIISNKSQKLRKVSQTFTNNQNCPKVTIIVPVYNEELVIERRLNNIFEADYPHDKLEIVIVDSGSDDNTTNIINTKFYNKVTIIKEDKRRGKAHAINLGIKASRGKILILTDGPTLYEKTTISSLVTSFQDPLIGGVTGLYRIQNKNENRITSIEDLQWSYKNKIRIMESKISSTSWLSGEACAFRKELLGHVDEDTLADDSNIALQLISKGYRAIANEGSIFMEKSPTGLGEYFRVKVRKALGGQQEIMRFKYLLFNRKFGLFGFLIFPYRFYVEIVNPILSIIAAGLIVLSILELTYIVGAAVLIMTIFIFGISSTLLIREKISIYIYLQIVLVVALPLLLFRRLNVNWYQSKTTRY